MTKQEDDMIMVLVFEEAKQAAYEEESLRDYFECVNDYYDGTMNV